MARRFNRSFAPTCHPEKLDEPWRLKKPSRIFVDSNGDLFDPAIPDGFIWQVFNEMRRAHWHTFLVLTKRAERMRQWFEFARESILSPTTDIPWPLPNVHIGVTVEDQAAADERIPLLLQTPAAVRFLSVEPIRGPISIEPFLWLTGASTAGPWRDCLGRKRGGGGVGGQMMSGRPSHDISWVIIGSDSRRGGYPWQPEWVEAIIAQCREAGVAVFTKGQINERFPIQELPLLEVG